MLSELHRRMTWKFFLTLRRSCKVEISIPTEPLKGRDDSIWSKPEEQLSRRKEHFSDSLNKRIKNTRKLINEIPWINIFKCRRNVQRAAFNEKRNICMDQHSFAWENKKHFIFASRKSYPQALIQFELVLFVFFCPQPWFLRRSAHILPGKHQHFHADRQLVTKKETSIKINSTDVNKCSWPNGLITSFWRRRAGLGSQRG